MKTIKAVLILVLFLLIPFFTGANTVFAQCEAVYVPLQEALDAMASDSQVTVATIPVPAWTPNPYGYTFNPDYYYEFSPAGSSPKEALIIYPGACLDARAYAPIARDIAAAGYLVVLVPMPDYLSVYGRERADAVISNYPSMQKWSIAGHSLGGVSACGYVRNAPGTFINANKINGLVLWASYPADTVYLDTYPIKAISIWGTNDGGMDETDVDNSKDNLPPDTRYVALEGANHSQFGWYGTHATDYGFVQPGDNPADITRQEQQDLIVYYTLSLLDLLSPGPKIPAALETIVAEDGSEWEQVSEPGFGNQYNTGVVALCPFQGSLYAMTRNDNTGFELWKTSGTGWGRVTVQGFTDDNDSYGFLVPWGGTTPLRFNLKQNIWCAMKEFQGKLYVTVTTGYQGSNLYGSIGFEMWRFDGNTWEPVIGSAAVSEETGTITGISGCAASDGDVTAQIADSTKNWTVDQWKGCVVRVMGAFDGTKDTVPGTPGIRMFNITGNTSNTLTIQENEVAAKTQDTICVEHTTARDPGQAANIVPAVVVGNAYAIECGTEERGFGLLWNKSVIDLAVLNDELYLAIALNYQEGARIWKTSDGVNWTPSSIYSFGLFHGFYPGYPPTIPNDCPGGGPISRNGTPVSSSMTHFGRSSVTGEETLYIGGTGTSGCNGRGARAAILNDNTWETMVDYYVDYPPDNSGTNENGFGDDGGDNGFQWANFQAWSWAEYDSHLFVGIARFVGARVMYTRTGLTDIKANDAWVYSVGGDSSLPGGGYSTVPDGFDGVSGAGGYAANGGSNLFVHNSALYAGTFVTNGFYEAGDPPIDGADIWKGTGPATSLTWTRVTGDGFGDPTILQFEAFTHFAGNMYVAASNSIPSDFAGIVQPGASGAKIYRLKETPMVIELISFDAVPGREKVTLHWVTASEIDNAGFNLYRAEAEDGEYVKINNALIPAKGSPTSSAVYQYIDDDIKNRKTYYYKLEDIDLNGKSMMHGPVSAVPRRMVR